MIVVNVIAESAAEDIAALKDAIHTMETKSRAEDGCIDYTFSVELNNPNVLRITEKWESMDALAVHFGVPHMAEFREAMAKHAFKSMNANFYEVTDVTPPGM